MKNEIELYDILKITDERTKVLIEDSEEKQRALMEIILETGRYLNVEQIGDSSFNFRESVISQISKDKITLRLLSDKPLPSYFFQYFKEIGIRLGGEQQTVVTDFSYFIAPDEDDGTEREVKVECYEGDLYDSNPKFIKKEKFRCAKMQVAHEKYGHKYATQEYDVLYCEIPLWLKALNSLSTRIGGIVFEEGGNQRMVLTKENTAMTEFEKGKEFDLELKNKEMTIEEWEEKYT